MSTAIELAGLSLGLLGCGCHVALLLRRRAVFLRRWLP